jgi:hypothetical protein
MKLPRRTLLTLALLSGCALPPREEARLPRAAQRPGGPEPIDEIIFAAYQAFRDPAALAGKPGAAALALGQLEYLAAIMGVGGPRRDLDPQAALPLRAGRAEARAALGFRAEAPPQTGIDALYGAAGALGYDLVGAGSAGGGQDRAAALAALAPLLGPGREAGALDRLAALPPLPLAQAGTERAWLALQRRETPLFRTHDVDL